MPGQCTDVPLSCCKHLSALRTGNVTITRRISDGCLQQDKLTLTCVKLTLTRIKPTLTYSKSTVAKITGVDRQVFSISLIENRFFQKTQFTSVFVSVSLSCCKHPSGSRAGNIASTHCRADGCLLTGQTRGDFVVESYMPGQCTDVYLSCCKHLSALRTGNVTITRRISDGCLQQDKLTLTCVKLTLTRIKPTLTYSKSTVAKITGVDRQVFSISLIENRFFQKTQFTSVFVSVSLSCCKHPSGSRAGNIASTHCGAAGCLLT